MEEILQSGIAIVMGYYYAHTLLISSLYIVNIEIKIM